MRILFTGPAAAGHLLPLLPLTEAALESGHSVALATPPKSADRLPPGVVHLPFDEPSETDRLRVRQETAGSSEPQVAAQTQIFGRLNPEAALHQMTAIVRDWRPDVVVSEASEFSGGLVAESLGLPLARVHPGLARLDIWERLVGPTLSNIRVRLGLPPDPEARWLLEAPQISFFPEAFEPPTTSSTAVCRVRRPSNSDQFAARTNTIYVTFGTEIPGMPMFAQLARDAVHAAQQTGAHVLLTVAHADPHQFADLHGVSIERWVNQDALLPTVRAVICHAGAGTTLGALTAATPIIAIPLFADQPFNAEQITNTRTGLAVQPGPDLGDRLCNALHEVLTTEPPGCKPMAEAIRNLPPLPNSIEMIAEVATGRRFRNAAH